MNECWCRKVLFTTIFFFVDAKVNKENWMRDLPVELTSLPLTDIAIPGSHDSGSYSIHPKNVYKYGIDKKFEKVFKAIANDSDSENFMASIMYRWGKTQSLNLTEQLKRGIRYLDIRLMKGIDHVWHVSHGIAGMTLTEALQQIKSFLLTHKKEVVLLDLNHVQSNIHKNNETQRSILKEVLDTFGPMLCPAKEVASLTLQRAWNLSVNVLFFYDPYPFKEEALYQEFASSSERIESPFNEKKFQQRTTWLSFLSNNYHSVRRSDSFHVTQGVMVPHWLEIVAAGTDGDLKRWISDDASQAFVKWLHSKKAGPDGINIVIMDFVEDHNFTDTVLKLDQALDKKLRSDYNKRSHIVRSCQCRRILPSSFMYFVVLATIFQFL